MIRTLTRRAATKHLSCVTGVLLRMSCFTSRKYVTMRILTSLMVRESLCSDFGRHNQNDDEHILMMFMNSNANMLHFGVN